jgi:hypothetical protein
MGSKTRAVLVAEALQQLQNQGLHIGLDYVTLESTCAGSGVPRSSSHAASVNDCGYATQVLFQGAVIHMTNAQPQTTEAAWARLG